MGHNTGIWETIWIGRLSIPICFGRFELEISDLKKIHASAKVNILFVLKEVRPEMELFLDNHLRCARLNKRHLVKTFSEL